MSEKHFIEGCENLRKRGEGSDEILNWYRNLYYKEEPNTERRIVAEALNDILPELVSLREKQTPKKPINKTLEYDGYYGRCPDCNRVIYDYKDRHRCYNCGQALDWSDTE